MKLSENKDFYNSVDKIIYWSKLFAVLMIIGAAFMALIALLALGLGSSVAEATNNGIASAAQKVGKKLLSSLNAKGVN